MGDEIRDLDSDWRAWRDAFCEFTVNLVPESVAAIKAMLDPKNVLTTGCEVVKHADCCLLCRDNEKCERLPVHPNCRCKRKPTLSSDDIANIE